MSLLELIPIGAFLSLLTNQVFETAVAARDVLIEKESFKALSKYLFDIEPVLKELQLRELNDTQAARQALEFLREDIKKAKDLVDKYKNRARFYLLVKCQYIVKEIQDVTRDIGSSLAALSLASTEVLSDISDKVNRLHGEMQKAEFEASQSQLRVVEKLDQGLRDQRRDQNFANNILEEIARAVGVPVEPSEISEELANLRREKEEAAARKERVEEYFLEQVIELLSRADASNDLERIRKQYYRRMETVEKYVAKEGYIPPLQAFLCPIDGAVMADPVSLCTGTSCERSAIEDWLRSGKITDPLTGQVLYEPTLWSNIPLRQSIEEWRELNYCLKIRSAKDKLLACSDSVCGDAFGELQDIVRENNVNKDWIAIEGIIEIILSIAGRSHNKEFKSNALLTLLVLTEGHARNKDRVVESGGVEHLVLCLAREPNVSKPAIELLFQLLQNGTKQDEYVCMKVKQQTSSILFLVMLLSMDGESAEKAEAILLKLCDDDETISRAAAVHWYKPLIDRLCNGPELSRISMARTLSELELIDQNIQLLGEEGVIASLVAMASGNLESKDLALSALVKLSTCHENKRRIAEAGGVPLILEQLFSSHAPTVIIAKCSEILRRLSSNDSMQFFLDANGASLNPEPIITNLLVMLQKFNLSPNIRKPALHALFNLCKSEALLMDKILASSNGVLIVLPLLEESDKEIREVALKVIHLFAQFKPDGIAQFLLVERRLEAFLGFLRGEDQGDIQTAAAGLLAFLPKSESPLMESMIKLDVLPLLLSILKKGTMAAKESVLSALLRFTDPTNIKMQQTVAQMDLYPLLVALLKSGSMTAKARAAAIIGNLSVNSSKLTVPPARTGCWCLWRTSVSVCELHGGICDESSTLCLLKANALPELVRLLQEHDNLVVSETLEALGTLVPENSPYKGANVLHEARAILPMLGILSSGTSYLKELVLDILEKVFRAREISDYYYTVAKIPLIGLAALSNENGNLGRKAATVLAELERYSKSGSMPLVSS